MQSLVFKKSVSSKWQIPWYEAEANNDIALKYNVITGSNRLLFDKSQLLSRNTWVSNYFQWVIMC